VVARFSKETLAFWDNQAEYPIVGNCFFDASLGPGFATLRGWEANLVLAKPVGKTEFRDGSRIKLTLGSESGNTDPITVDMIFPSVGDV
jgi:hypothetical protein